MIEARWRPDGGKVAKRRAADGGIGGSSDERVIGVG